MSDLFQPYNTYTVDVPTKEADDALDAMNIYFEQCVREAKDGGDVNESKMLKLGAEFARSLLHYVWQVETDRKEAKNSFEAEADRAYEVMRDVMDEIQVRG